MLCLRWRVHVRHGAATQQTHASHTCHDARRSTAKQGKNSLPGCLPQAHQCHTCLLQKPRRTARISRVRQSVIVLRLVSCRFVQGYNEKDPKSHKGYNVHKMSMGALYKEYGLDPMTVDFIGHAIALHRCCSPRLPTAGMPACRQGRQHRAEAWLCATQLCAYSGLTALHMWLTG